MEMEPSNDINKTTVRLVRTAFSIIFFMFVSPITICDIIYGFSGDECLNEYPNDIHLNLKRYLLVSGFVQLFMILYMIYKLNNITIDKETPFGLMVIDLIISPIMALFHLIWNILGAIVFWGYIYEEGHCETDVSNYLFASIVIKLVMTYFNIIKNLNNSDSKQ
jgi:hypothetical protein